MTLEERYANFCATPSSINQHLPLLRDYASRCQSVAEFGVDIGQSTTALLMGQPKWLISLDVVRKPELDELFSISRDYQDLREGWWVCFIGETRWTFSLNDTRCCVIHPVDLLLIDSSHWYGQMQAELARHAGQVRKWIICHDTVAYGEFGEAGPPQVGILPAIEEFLAEHTEWRVAERLTNNNGLLIMERTDG